MGYFSTGSEGMNYETNVCEHCVHYVEPDDGGCPVWMLHLLYNHDQIDDANLEECLSTLIPEHGIYNLLCTMFVPSDERGEYVKEEWDKYHIEKSKEQESEA